ncbi:MAG: hypothetical protein LKE86_08250 [Eubacterium sp.]|nr:hypothetical protein [Eubacterium sp.]MCH4047398.1 hypothetical protein [Eubacterium sp.]MCH4080495.1 hypothetical protein [Eubacterium sp.]MCI1521185.1 hypothetical protein [Eubacterium sp.]
MTRTKSSRALLSVVLAVLMVAAFMPALTYSSFAATAKKATKVTKLNHTGAKVYGKVGSKYTLKYKLSPSKLTSAAQKTVWKSSDSKIVKVIATKGKHATVKVKGVGTAKVTVYTKANTKAKATWTFKTKKADTKKVAATGVTVKANNTTDDITKTLNVGTELTATVAPSDATGVTYQWYADGEAIKDATSANFTVTTDQIGKTITVKATDDSKNTVESAKTAAVAQPTLEGITGITGITGYTTTVKVGDKLTVAAADGSTVKNLEAVATIQWYRVTKDINNNDVETAISGATSASYTVTAADKDATLKVKVTPKSGVKARQTSAVNWNSDAKAYVATTGNVAASDTLDSVAIQVNGAVPTEAVKAGTTLTAVVTPAAASSDVDYQWYKGGYKIDGATSATYTPTESGSYTVKATVKSTSTSYKTGFEDSNPVTVKASKTFTGVTVTNVDAKNANRTTTLAGDKIAVSVSGIKADAANYTAELDTVKPGDYGQTEYTTVKDVKATVAGDAYVMNIPSNAAAGTKYVVVLTGQGTNSDYGYTSDVMTVTTSANEALTGYSTSKVADAEAYKLSAPRDKTINKDYTVQWYKVTKDATGLVSRTEISGATGNTYELTTADQTADATAPIVTYVAKVTLTDGTVGYVTGLTIAPKIDDSALL